MKIAHLAVMVVGLAALAGGCSLGSEDTIPQDPDKNGSSFYVGGTDKSRLWLKMTCKPVGDTFTFTVEGDHLVDAAIQLSAPGKGGAPTIGAGGKLPPYTITGVKKEELVRYSYRLADGSSERMDLKGCTRQ